MKITILAIATLVFAALCQAQIGTFDPLLPDASLYDYTGDQSITAIISSVDFRRQVSVYNSATCGTGGTQGTPANPFAFYVAGRLTWSGSNGYPVDPATGGVVLQCLPLQVGLVATWASQRQDQVNDHLYQANTVVPLGSLPSPQTKNAVVGTIEACSLIGVYGLGTAYIDIDQKGQCVFYGSGTGPVPPGGGAKF